MHDEQPQPKYACTRDSGTAKQVGPLVLRLKLPSVVTTIGFEHGSGAEPDDELDELLELLELEDELELLELLDAVPPSIVPTVSVMILVAVVEERVESAAELPVMVA